MPEHLDARMRPAPAAPPAHGRLSDVEYVLPLRWTSDAELADLTDYLTRLAGLVPVTVVDGSPEPLFGLHARAWGRLVRHVRPDRWPALNGKVRGVMTGVLLSRAEKVVVADDDVRYDALTLARVAALLDSADVVIPQNAFDPVPWHARWDSARSLVNRGLGGDWPGTLAVRRSTLVRAGGYDGHVLFENLELVRTVASVGGRVRRAGGVVVRRRPPSARHFWSQRTRQAYDDLAQPARLVVEAALLPAALAAGRRRPALLGIGLVALLAVAARGRRRAGGEVFPATALLFVPLWAAERAVCVWLALGWLAAGGVPYAGQRLRRAATPPRRLRDRATL